MTIELITERQYDLLLYLYNKYPNLTYENTGYDYLDKNKLSPKEIIIFKVIQRILKRHIHCFVEFNHFKHNKAKEVCVRFQYRWSESFTGVGYLKLSNLLNGFDEPVKNKELI
jgi:hypothetical protein